MVANKPVGAGDLGNLEQAARDMVTDLLAGDAAKSVADFWSIMDEIRAAWAGTPVPPAVQTAWKGVHGVRAAAPTPALASLCKTHGAKVKTFLDMHDATRTAGQPMQAGGGFLAALMALLMAFLQDVLPLVPTPTP